MLGSLNWRGRLVAYGAALERRFTRKGIEGSNPSLSANLCVFKHLNFNEMFFAIVGEDRGYHDNNHRSN